jgi:hypothetical protein
VEGGVDEVEEEDEGEDEGDDGVPAPLEGGREVRE